VEVLATPSDTTLNVTMTSQAATMLGSHDVTIADLGITCNSGNVFLNAPYTPGTPVIVKAPVRVHHKLMPAAKL
jgi:hypothetical protein